MNKKKEKKSVLTDNPVQSRKNAKEFVKKFKKEHQDLMYGLACIEPDKE